MRNEAQPLYLIGIAATLCGVHPQTLRQYERLGLVSPVRIGARNRLYSEQDILRVRRIQRLTQELGVNLAGVEIILRLLDDLEETRKDLEDQLHDYMLEAEKRIAKLLANTSIPVRKDEKLLPVPNLELRKMRKIDV